MCVCGVNEIGQYISVLLISRCESLSFRLKIFTTQVEFHSCTYACIKISKT